MDISETETSKTSDESNSKKEKSSRGIAVYLDTIFKEKEKTLKEASKIKTKYQYLLEDKKQLQNRIRYLEEKLASTSEKATLVERNKNRTLTENISQSIQM